MDEINIINDPADEFSYVCPKHGRVDDNHDIEYCLSL